MLWLLNTILHVVATPVTIKLFLLPLHNCDFATVMNHNLNIWCAEYLIFNPCERVIWPSQRGCGLQVENRCSRSEVSVSQRAALICLLIFVDPNLPFEFCTLEITESCYLTQLGISIHLLKSYWKSAGVVQILSSYRVVFFTSFMLNNIASKISFDLHWMRISFGMWWSFLP